MKVEEIRAQERRLAALTYDQSPCRAFKIEPQAEDSNEWIDLVTGPDGEGFLTYWMLGEARRRLQSVGVYEQEPGVWTLALDFGGDLWAAYTLRAMARSTWSRVLFPLAKMGKTWPEGVVLAPDEAEFTLGLLADLFGVVLPGEHWTVLVFIAKDYGVYELEELATRLLTDDFQRAAYLQVPSPLVRLPRPVFTLEFPNAAPMERLQFLPPRPDIEIDPDSDPSDRLFKEHWILRLINPPEKECHHE